jgi:hypothetical protein
MEQVAAIKGFKIGEDQDGRSVDVYIDTICTDLSVTWGEVL